MSFIIAIIIGGLAGYVASLVLNRNQNQGIIGNIIVGVIGAFLGNLLVGPLFGTHVALSHPTVGGFILAVVGAMILLAILNLITRKKLR